MDGYSVHDAAAVLGIPETRVWELIARGVLSGTPQDDGGMRVFLKRTAPAPAEPAAPANGNGGAHEVELSPFRELLTEFRNLTERYGQALLALGESRGEVAALRSRVDLLEARIDLRLPGGRPQSTVAWEVPEHTAPSNAEPSNAEPSYAADSADADSTSGAASADVAVPQAPPVVEATEATEAPRTSPRRRRGPRTSPAAFAEALARAQDPTLPELPGAREAAEALAALRDIPPAEPVAADAPEPIEPQMAEVLDPLVAAAPMIETPVIETPMIETPASDDTTADEWTEAVAAEATVDEPPDERPAASSPAESIYSTELVEPDWFADGDFSWLEQAAAAEAEAPADQPAPAAESDETAGDLTEETPGGMDAGVVEADLAVDPSAGPQTAERLAGTAEETETIASGDAIPESGPAMLSEPEAVADDAIESSPVVIADVEDLATGFDTIDIALAPSVEPAEGEMPSEPEWLWVADTEPGAEWAGRQVEISVRPGEEAEPEAARPSEPEIEPGASAASLGGDEVELMFLGDEFNAAELEFAAPGWGGPASGAPHAPTGPWEPAQPPPAEEPMPVAEPQEQEHAQADLGRPPAALPGAAPTETPRLPAAGPYRPAPAQRQPAPGDPDWLRGRRGPAATAYRRLRRLFPG